MIGVLHNRCDISREQIFSERIQVQTKKPNVRVMDRKSEIMREYKWGLSKWGLKVLVHNCPRLPTIVVIL